MCDLRNENLLHLDPDDRIFAEKYLKEVNRDEVIQRMKNWIVENKNIISRTDDFFILRFLRGCKFDIERAQWKLQNYLMERTLIPEWYQNRNPFLPEIQALLDLGVMLPLRKVDDHGRMVIIVRACVQNPNKHKQNDVFKTDLMVADLALRDNVAATVKGVVTILDMKGVGLSHATQLTPNMIKRLVNLWQSCYPLRLQSIEFVNAPIHVNFILNIFKQFMSQKLKERTKAYSGTYIPIHNTVPVRILPQELGGTEEDYESLKKYWKRECENNALWFKEDEKYKGIVEQTKESS